MKKPIIFLALALLSCSAFAQKQVEVTIITTIEQSSSLGRSRMLIEDDKSGKPIEVDLENFEGIGGVKLTNLNNNNRIISKKIAEMYANGWELAQTTASEAERRIFSRYIFIRKK